MSSDECLSVSTTLSLFSPVLGLRASLLGKSTSLSFSSLLLHRFSLPGSGLTVNTIHPWTVIVGVKMINVIENNL